MANQVARVKFRIIGKVQGVGLRVWIQMEARRRNLHGWVKNEADGSVAALLLGDVANVASVSSWLSTGNEASNIFDTCELELEPNDLNWETTSGFHILS